MEQKLNTSHCAKVKAVGTYILASRPHQLHLRCAATETRPVGINSQNKIGGRHLIRLVYLYDIDHSHRVTILELKHFCQQTQHLVTTKENCGIVRFVDDLRPPDCAQRERAEFVVHEPRLFSAIRFQNSVVTRAR